MQQVASLNSQFNLFLTNFNLLLNLEYERQGGVLRYLPPPHEDAVRHPPTKKATLYCLT